MTIDELIIRCLRNEASEIEVRRVEDWRRQSSANEQRYRQTASLCSLVRQLNPPPPTVRPPTSTFILASRKPAFTTVALFTRRPSWRTGVGAFALAAVLLLIVIRSADVDQPATPIVASTQEGTTFETGPDERRSITIADGILVHMAASTRIELVRDRPEPEIIVEGRAFFGVPRQNGRRVQIRTSAGTVTVLGTRFDLRSNNGDLQLMVVDGGVSILASNESREVRGGELGLVNGGEIEAVVKIEDPFKYLAWMGPAIVFQATPLQRVAVEIESRFDVRFDPIPPELTNRTITAVFDGEDLDSLLAIACSVMQVNCEVIGRTVRVSEL
jgi:transmembrane sensor